MSRSRLRNSSRLIRCGRSLRRPHRRTGHEEPTTPKDAPRSAHQADHLPDVHDAPLFLGRRGAGGTEYSGTVAAHMMVPTIVRYQTATNPPRE